MRQKIFAYWRDETNGRFSQLHLKKCQKKRPAYF